MAFNRRRAAQDRDLGKQLPEGCDSGTAPLCRHSLHYWHGGLQILPALPPWVRTYACWSPLLSITLCACVASGPQLRAAPPATVRERLPHGHGLLRRARVRRELHRQGVHAQPPGRSLGLAVCERVPTCPTSAGALLTTPASAQPVRPALHMRLPPSGGRGRAAAARGVHDLRQGLGRALPRAHPRGRLRGHLRGAAHHGCHGRGAGDAGFWKGRNAFGAFIAEVRPRPAGRQAVQGARARRAASTRAWRGGQVHGVEQAHVRTSEGRRVPPCGPPAQDLLSSQGYDHYLFSLDHFSRVWAEMAEKGVGEMAKEVRCSGRCWPRTPPAQRHRRVSAEPVPVAAQVPLKAIPPVLSMGMMRKVQARGQGCAPHTIAESCTGNGRLLSCLSRCARPTRRAPPRQEDHAHGVAARLRSGASLPAGGIHGRDTISTAAQELAAFCRQLEQRRGARGPCSPAGAPPSAVGGAAETPRAGSTAQASAPVFGSPRRPGAGGRRDGGSQLVAAAEAAAAAVARGDLAAFYSVPLFSSDHAGGHVLGQAGGPLGSPVAAGRSPGAGAGACPASTGASVLRRELGRRSQPVRRTPYSSVRSPKCVALAASRAFRPVARRLRGRLVRLRRAAGHRRQDRGCDRGSSLRLQREGTWEAPARRAPARRVRAHVLRAAGNVGRFFNHSCDGNMVAQVSVLPGPALHVMPHMPCAWCVQRRDEYTAN
jgi:hypothetical protein